MTKITYIPGEIANAAIDEQGNRKPVTRTHHIFDDAKGKSQADINKEFGNAIGGLNNQNYITVDNFNALPDTGEADTVYRVSNWDGTQQDPTVYSEYAWDGNQYVHLSTKTQIGEVFDISAYHATGGNLATYADLSAALDSNNGGGVPQSLQKGGMSIKFVQSSDNKYIQYRLMADTFSTNESDWQGIDEELKPNSKNLAESGVVFGELNTPIYNSITLENYINGYIQTTGNVGESVTYRIYYVPCVKGDRFKLNYQAFDSSIAAAYGIYSAENIADISSSNKITIGPVGSAGVEYDIEITSESAKWLVVQEYYPYNTPRYGADLKKLSYISKFDELNENEVSKMISSKDWNISGNIVYDSNEVPQSYNITWADGTAGTVVMSNFNEDVFEYSTITATYKTKTIVYTLTYDVNGYITNETLNIQ